MSVSRCDNGFGFGTIKRTPQGGLRVPAFLTRSGIFVYKRMDGTEVREWRPPAEVFKADSISTLAGATITDKHPSEAVNPRNFRNYAVGHLFGEAKQDGNKLAGVAIIQDADAIQAVENKKRREISCGYRCDIEETAGVTPDGERYDRIQRNIKYNHVALVEKGRAGSEVRLRLDSEDNLAPITGVVESGPNGAKDKTIMNPEEIQKLMAAKVAAEARADSATANVEAITAERDTATARADEAERKLGEAETKLAELSDPARMDAAVSERSTVVAKVAKLAPDFKVDGQSNHTLKVAAITAAVEGFDASEKSEAYINGRFDALDVPAPKTSNAEAVRQAAAAATLGGGAEAKDDSSDADKARDKARQDGLEAWQKPLAFTKVSG